MGNQYSDSDSERDIWEDDTDSDMDSDCSTQSEKEWKLKERKQRRQEREARRKEHSPSRKRAKLEMKYCNSDNDSEEEQHEYDTWSCSFTDKRSSIKIDCDWKIDGFPDPSIHNKKNFFMQSRLFAAGTCNQFQFYFIMEKMVDDKDTHWGVYVNIISNVRSEASVKIKSYIVNHKNNSVFLNKPKEAQFPRKTGYRFLGSINKDRFIDDDYNQCSYMGEGELTFRFRIEVNYKSSHISNELEQLFSQKREKDVTLVVKGTKFKANKKILAERSGTFAKLLGKEKVSKLKIDDVEPDIMKQLLIFIYTNLAPKILSSNKKLLAAADKYKVKDLQVMCKKVKAAIALNPQLK